jgi:DNA adenine methylase
MAISGVSSSISVKPFLRWAGSKQQLVPTMSRFWDSSYVRYIEPFAGSASWFFYISPSSAILSDINKELISTYQQVKKNLPEVINSLNKLRVGKENYYRLRSADPSLLSPPARAANFIYLNRFSFNGLYRTNRAGKFNVPYNGGAGNIPTVSALESCSKALQSAKLIACSFEETLEKTKIGDFVYLDPPFSVKARRIFNEYDASIFNQKQLMLLRDWMTRLNKNNIPFLVSYADAEEGNFLSKGFYKEIVKVRRNIAGFAANRKNANELLISNVRPKNIGGVS